MNAGGAEPIYHLVREAELRDRLGPDVYRPADLVQIGFVHCARRASVLPVADDYFAEAQGPVLVLEIDPARLAAETRDEAPAPLPGGGRTHLAGGGSFPHVYGPIDRSAITAVGVLVRGPAGFAWPARTQALDAFLAASA